MNRLENLFKEVPAKVLEKTVDDVMIEYAITSIKDEQQQTQEEAINNIRNMKHLRDTINSCLCTDINQ